MKGPGSVISFSMCLSSGGKQQSPVDNDMAHTHTQTLGTTCRRCASGSYNGERTTTTTYEGKRVLFIASAMSRSSLLQSTTTSVKLVSPVAK